MSKSKALIIDIDGTLSNCTHREHYLKQEKRDFKSFARNEEIEKDSLNHWCAAIISNFKHNHKIILLTTRQEFARETTENWLKKYDIPYDLLIMKSNDDYRKGNISKEEIYKSVIYPNYDVTFAIDDSKHVAEMWRKLGLVCLQCDNGDF